MMRKWMAACVVVMVAFGVLGSVTAHAVTLTETVQALEKNNRMMKERIAQLGAVFQGTDAKAMMEGFPVLMYASKFENLSFALYKVTMRYLANTKIHDRSGAAVMDIVYDSGLKRAESLLEQTKKLTCGAVPCSHKANLIRNAEDLLAIIKARVDSRPEVKWK